VKRPSEKREKRVRRKEKRESKQRGVERETE
jgi:hypothetical protein